MISTSMSGGEGLLEQSIPAGDKGASRKLEFEEDGGRLKDRTGSYKEGIRSKEVTGKRRAEEESISERRRLEKLEEMRSKMSPKKTNEWEKGRDLSEEWETNWGGKGGSSGAKEEATGGGIQAGDLRRILKEELDAKLDPINSRLDQMEESNKKKLIELKKELGGKIKANEEDMRVLRMRIDAIGGEMKGLGEDDGVKGLVERKHAELMATIGKGQEEMKGRVVGMEEKMSKLEVEVSKLKLGAPPGLGKGGGKGGSAGAGGGGGGRPDDSYQMMAVYGFEKESGLEERLNAMRGFMSTHFPAVPVADMSIIFTGSYKEGNRVPTRTGYIKFGSGDIRDYVMKKIEGSSLKMKCGGKDLDIRKWRSKAATDRNGALKKACDLIKAKVEDPSKVKIEWVGERGVTIDGVYGFVQGPGNGMGEFCGSHVGLKWPA